MADAGQKLTFIHLSDIHFVRDFSGQSAFDIDKFVRNELVLDARRVVLQLGQISGILVSGDIAFAGKAGDYETALTWLSELSDSVNCSPGLVWSVPGNHDVDRSVLKEHTTIQATQQQIRTHENLDSILKQHLQSGDASLQYGPLVSHEAWQGVEQNHTHLSTSQRAAVEQILATKDKIVGLEGVAGAGKTTSLSAIREAAEREGYQVIGLAPTSRAAHKLAESGIESHTLQRQLIRNEAPNDGQKRLFVIDESSLASTKQMNEFFHRLHTSDRVLLVGDTRQHEAVEAGRPYKQLQEAGMQTAKLGEIVRQKDPALKEAVEQLARGDVHGGIASLEQQGRVHEIVNPQERFSAIAREYSRNPEGNAGHLARQ